MDHDAQLEDKLRRRLKKCLQETKHGDVSALEHQPPVEVVVGTVAMPTTLGAQVECVDIPEEAESDQGNCYFAKSFKRPLIYRYNTFFVAPCCDLPVAWKQGSNLKPQKREADVHTTHHTQRRTSQRKTGNRSETFEYLGGRSDVYAQKSWRFGSEEIDMNE